MIKYLVGGAVRDRLLGLKSNDLDYIVLGETHESMISKGFKQVGLDFPVYLDEKGDEHALPRKERKLGHGYGGFECITENVTIEEDLMRRDLTINAIAIMVDELSQDRSLDDITLIGTYIDPCNGFADLKNKILRHTTEAFKEDPVRVLRLARFYARYADIGFTVAPETIELCKKMVSDGDLDYLTAERVWKETEKALSTSSPQVYLDFLHEVGALKVVFPELDALVGVEQPAKYHPEGDAFQHTMCAMKVACELGAPLDVMYSVMLHDVGKGLTDPKLWPSHKGHEQAGVPLVKAISERLKVPKNTKELAMIVTEHHQIMHRIQEVRPMKALELMKTIGAFGNKSRVENFIMACKCDSFGRDFGIQPEPSMHYKQGDYLKGAIEKAKEVTYTTANIMFGETGKKAAERIIIERGKTLSKYRKEHGLNCISDEEVTMSL